MSEQIRMLFVLAISVILMILSINLSTHSSESKYIKEDLEIAVHDAALALNKDSLSEGAIEFEQTEALNNFKKSLEINTGMVEGEDYTILELEFFDQVTNPSNFYCETLNHGDVFTYNSTKVNAEFTITCPSVIAVIQHTSDNYIYLPGISTDGNEITKGAAYTYEFDSNALQTASMTNLMLEKASVSSLLHSMEPDEKGYYWVVPSTTNITSHFSPSRVNPVTGVLKPHTGTDIASEGIESQPAVSITDGVVSYAGIAGGYGNVVQITHKDGLVTRYAHLNQILVTKGQSISGGEVVGLIGSTGNSTGPHLHFETIVNGKPINPLELFN